LFWNLKNRAYQLLAGNELRRWLFDFLVHLREGAPGALFGFGLLVFGFAVGLAAAHYKWPIYRNIREAKVSAELVRSELFPPKPFWAGVKASDIWRARIRVMRPNHYSEGFQFTGGFSDVCPHTGCLFVVVSRDGKVLQSMPFRSAELFPKDIVKYSYERLFFDPNRDISPWSAWPVGEDWVASIAFGNSFPYGGGLARISNQGHVIWYRGDYAHHWASPLSNGDFVTPRSDIIGKPIHVVIAPDFSYDVKCDRSNKALTDIIEVVGQDGKVKESISVTDAILRSPYRARLITTFDPCDPTHVNFVREIGSDLAMRLGGGLKSDDFLVSMRTISAFGILSRRSKTFVRMYRGTFAYQHSVQPLDGTRVVMFDNLGGDHRDASSRLLTYDLATGDERVIFPNASTPDAFRSHSIYAGFIDLSPDKKRALIAYTEAGKAYEVDLSDGSVITVFEGLDLESKTGRVVRVPLTTLRYAVTIKR